MSTKKPVDAKNTMLLHSEAKVDFYKTYLEMYLRILYLSPFVDVINIFDVFCGTGIYDNEKKGSPIVAFEAIKKLREEYDFYKKINLVVNDSNESKVTSVQSYIDSKNEHHCNVTYHAKSAERMFEDVIENINQQNNRVRNLIFIDPYGYKEIKKATLEALLKNGRTEIIMFLPISQMQRFTAKAVDSNLKAYEPLKEFVYSFFEANHPIKEQGVKALDYIKYVKDALRFDKSYFTTSYYIERDEANYYGLFFISHHIYGFEKILEVKWRLDEVGGRGFKQPVIQKSLFEQQDKDTAKNNNYIELENILKAALETPKNNLEIYEVVLHNEFLPSHAKEIFTNWQETSNKFEVIEIETNKKARAKSFYTTWENYKSEKPKVTFTLKK